MIKTLLKIIKNRPPKFYTRKGGLPASWDDVCIRELRELNSIYEMNKLTQNPFRRNNSTLNLFGVDTKNMSVLQVSKVLASMPFLQKELPKHFPPKFYLNDVLYLCHANIKEIPAWAAISITNYSEASVENNMHYIAACLIWEKDNKAPEATIEQRAQYFLNNLPASVIHGLCAFFLSNSKLSLAATRNYLEKKMMKERKKTPTGS